MSLFRVDNPAWISSLLEGGYAFLPPAALLEDLTAEHAHAKPSGLPHSIAEIVAHMAFWQEWFNRCASQGYAGLPEHAADGWPGADSWPEACERYLAAVREAKRLAESDSPLHDPLLPAGAENPFLAQETKGSGLIHAAMHSGHHLGQIVTIRQLLGVWPPRAGSLTW